MEVDAVEPPTSPKTAKERSPQTAKDNERSPQTAKERMVPEQLMNGDEDPYKPEGHVTLKIEKFSEFAREGGDSGRRLSESLYVRGLPWKILAIPRDIGRRQMGPPQKALGYFLQCNSENTDASWSCAGSATLKILAQKEGKEDHARKINHVFHAKENDWGFAQFMTFDNLMDPESGWYDEEADSIILAVDMTADAPHGVKWNSKKDTGCIGLKNQGATCYMNSILQTLFFTNKLRKAVYQMPTEDDNPDSSVALAMQRVFYELQFSESPVGTKKLTKSFGWDSIENFLQCDVQEFCRVLLDNLENKMKNTKVGDTIPSLFKGRMKSYIKCKEVSFESSREECFYDIQLNVKNKANVMESFKDYIEPEIMDGEDKYDAGEHGLQPAEKGLKFISFPPVLHLQLMRFQYDPLLGTNVKINDRFEFPDVLELHEFVDAEKKENIKSDYVYLLHAVLVHSGDFHGGHYVAFINMNLNGTPKWCKFDDDVVSRVAHRDAVTANFGGENPDGIGRANTNAYMLVYIQKNAVEEVLCPLAADDIPGHLKVRFDSETKKEMEKKIEREEANNYCEITLILDEEMKAHHEFELFDHKLLEVQNRKMKVQKNMNFKELYNFVAKNLNVPEDSFRLWDFQEADDRRAMHRFRSENIRPRYFLDPNDIDDEETVRADKTVYLEMGKLGPDGEFTLTPFNRRTDTFIFLKFYNTERKLTEFKGTMILNLETEISSYHEEMNQLIGLPSDTRINLYIELKPDRIVPIHGPPNILKVRDEPNLHQKGAIIVAEIVEKVTGEMNTQAYFRALLNKIEVEMHLHEFVSNGNSESESKQTIHGQISLDWNLPRLCAWIQEQEPGHQLERILLWKVTQPSEKPFMFISTDQYKTFNVCELLNVSNYYDPRNKRTFKMYYSVLPFPFFEMEKRKLMSLQILQDDFKINEIAVFPLRNATVKDIIEEARPEFKFAPNGTGQLRLVYVYHSASCLRVFQALNGDMTLNELLQKNNSSAYMYRIEEIPKDQLEIGPNEHLFPVGHFDRDPARMFGVPFLIKVSNSENVRDIRQKIREILRVPEKEFEKYKLHIVMKNALVRELDTDEESTLQNLNEFFNVEAQRSLNSEPYLGIDHFNKMRTGRAGEKSIIIHN